MSPLPRFARRPFRLALSSAALLLLTATASTQAQTPTFSGADYAKYTEKTDAAAASFADRVARRSPVAPVSAVKRSKPTSASVQNTSTTQNAQVLTRQNDARSTLANVRPVDAPKSQAARTWEAFLFGTPNRPVSTPKFAFAQRDADVSPLRVERSTQSARSLQSPQPLQLPQSAQPPLRRPTRTSPPLVAVVSKNSTLSSRRADRKNFRAASRLKTPLQPTLRKNLARRDTPTRPRSRFSSPSRAPNARTPFSKTAPNLPATTRRSTPLAPTARKSDKPRTSNRRKRSNSPTTASRPSSFRPARTPCAFRRTSSSRPTSFASRAPRPLAKRPKTRRFPKHP